MNEGRDVWSGGNMAERSAEIRKSLKQGFNRYKGGELFPKKTPPTEVELMEKELEKVQDEIEKERARRRDEGVVEKEKAPEAEKPVEGDTESPFASGSPVDKDGTSEGAKLGWETRRHGKPAVDDEAETVDDEAETENEEETEETEIPAPPLKPLPKATESEKEHERKRLQDAWNKAIVSARKIRAGISRPVGIERYAFPEFDSLLRRRMSTIKQPKKMKNFADVLEERNHHTLALEARQRLQQMGYDSNGKPLQASTASKDIFFKDGTSEGAKKGWETRRRGGAKEEQPGERKPWANLNPEEELPGLKGLDPEKAYKIEEQMDDVDQTLKRAKEKLNRMNSIGAREGRRLGEEHPYFDVKSGIKDGMEQIDSLLESIKGHADEGKRQSLVDESKKIQSDHDYYGDEALEETVDSLSKLSSKVTALIDGEDSGGKDKSLSERLDDVAKRHLSPEILSKDMVEKVLKDAGWDKLPISDKARESIEDMISKGAKPATEFTGKIMIERGFPEEPPAFVRPNTLNVGDRVVPLDWRWIGGHGATIDLPNVPEAKRIKKLYTGPAKVSKNSYPYGRYPKDLSKVETVTEDRLWGFETEDRLGKQGDDDTMSLPVTTRDTTLVLRVPAMASPEGEVNTGESIRD